MKTIPQIQKFMTPMPHSVGAQIQLKVALELMRTHGIRHLPVQEAGRLVGILTDRDIKLASSFDGAETLTVEEVMTPDPYVVTPQSPVDHVVEEMAKHKYGSALVVQENGKLVGIFTATDALLVLSELLHKNYREAGEGRSAARSL
jgi:acetoin utilization protein AcuB